MKRGYACCIAAVRILQARPGCVKRNYCAASDEFEFMRIHHRFIPSGLRLALGNVLRMSNPGCMLDSPVLSFTAATRESFLQRPLCTSPHHGWRTGTGASPTLHSSGLDWCALFKRAKGDWLSVVSRDGRAIKALRGSDYRRLPCSHCRGNRCQSRGRNASRAC